jgi:hypothetical protein
MDTSRNLTNFISSVEVDCNNKHSGCQQIVLDYFHSNVVNQKLDFTLFNKPITKLNFLDLGSGYGTVIAKAQEMRFNLSYGIEHEKRVFESSKKLLKNYSFSPSVVEGDYFLDDLSTLSFGGKKISEIDVFFLYEYARTFDSSTFNPITGYSSDGVEHGRLVFEKVFAKYAKSGAILLRESPRSQFHEDSNFLNQHDCGLLTLAVGDSNQKFIRKN